MIDILFRRRSLRALLMARSYRSFEFCMLRFEAKFLHTVGNKKIIVEILITHTLGIWSSER